MITLQSTEKCKDCGSDVFGYFYGNEELILCYACKLEFKNWIRNDSSRTYCLSCHDEFISENGNRHERDARSFEEYFSETSAPAIDHSTELSNVELISRVMRSSADRL